MAADFSIAKEFKSWMEAQGMWYAYVRYWNECSALHEGVGVLEWLERTEGTRYVYYAFYWDTTAEGDGFWCDLNSDWNEHLVGLL